MTAPDWTELAARQPFRTPRVHRGAMEPAIHLTTSPIPAVLAAVGGAIRIDAVAATSIATFTVSGLVPFKNQGAWPRPPLYGGAADRFRVWGQYKLDAVWEVRRRVEDLHFT
jgi:hypothetical protein